MCLQRACRKRFLESAETDIFLIVVICENKVKFGCCPQGKCFWNWEFIIFSFPCSGRHASEKLMFEGSDRVAKWANYRTYNWGGKKECFLKSVFLPKWRKVHFFFSSEGYFSLNIKFEHNLCLWAWRMLRNLNWGIVLAKCRVKFPEMITNQICWKMHCFDRCFQLKICILFSHFSGYSILVVHTDIIATFLCGMC